MEKCIPLLVTYPLPYLRMYVSSVQEGHKPGKATETSEISYLEEENINFESSTHKTCLPLLLQLLNYLDT